MTTLSELKHQNDFAGRWTAAQPLVAAYIASVVRDYHETEDLLQKVAVVAFRKQADYQPDQPFVAWACGIARYELLRWRRDKARSRVVFTDATINHLAEVQEDLELELDERKAALRHCVGRLDRKAMSLLELRYMDGLTPTHIAEKRQMKPGAVRIALYRIRQVLEQCIRRRLAGSGADG